MKDTAMLLVDSALRGYDIEAIDGCIGTVSDFLFDDTNWKLPSRPRFRLCLSTDRRPWDRPMTMCCIEMSTIRIFATSPPLPDTMFKLWTG